MKLKHDKYRKGKNHYIKVKYIDLIKKINYPHLQIIINNDALEDEFRYITFLFLSDPI